MSWIAIIVDPDDKKIKINWFYPKKTVFDTIQGDQFLYMFLFNLIKSLVPIVKVFFS